MQQHKCHYQKGTKTRPTVQLLPTLQSYLHHEDKEDLTRDKNISRSHTHTHSRGKVQGWGRVQRCKQWCGRSSRGAIQFTPKAPPPLPTHTHTFRWKIMPRSCGDVAHGQCIGERKDAAETLKPTNCDRTDLSHSFMSNCNQPRRGG